MDTSLRLFATKGFELTSVQEIVSEAGLTKGAFYHHFAAKDDVLREIHDELIESLLERSYAVIARGLGPRETLEVLIEEMLVSFEESNDAVSVFFRERRSLTPAALEQVRAKRDQYERIMIAVFERGVASGEFKPVANIRLTVFGIIGMCAWAHEWFDPNGTVRAHELAALYSDMVMTGVAARAMEPAVPLAGPDRTE